MRVPVGFRFHGSPQTRPPPGSSCSPSARRPVLRPTFAGARVYPVAELLCSYLEAIGRRRQIMPMRIPGKAAQAARGRQPRAEPGQRTWEVFLADRLG